MKLKLTLVSVAFASLTVAAYAGPSAMEIAKKAASDYRTATLKKDFAAFEKESTPDFVYINAKGVKTTKAQAIEGMKGFFSALTIKTIKVSALSAKMTGGELVYIQEEWLEGSMAMGKPKPSVFSSHSKDEVHLVNKGGKWLTKLVKNLMTDDKIDGKKMPGM